MMVCHEHHPPISAAALPMRPRAQRPPALPPGRRLRALRLPPLVPRLATAKPDPFVLSAEERRPIILVEPTTPGTVRQAPQVALIKDVYSRVEHLIHEVAKFGIVGGIAYIATILVDLAYLQIERNDHLTAYIVGNVVATCVAYLGSRFWTYKGRDGGGAREMVLFTTINGIAIAMQAGIVALTFYVLHMTSKVENFFSEFILAIGLGMVFRFFCYRTFIFPKAEPALAADEFQYSEPLPTGQLPSATPRSDTGALLPTKKR